VDGAREGCETGEEICGAEELMGVEVEGLRWAKFRITI
jgi:hypothetical protein